jgi:hypothetical protein
MRLSSEDVKLGVLASRVESGMERRFTVEAKTFFSTKASLFVWRKGGKAS